MEVSCSIGKFATEKIQINYYTSYFLSLEPKSLSNDGFTTPDHDIAKIIWKARCKERQRCPRAGVIIFFYDELGNEKVYSLQRLFVRLKLFSSFCRFG
jgi:hypothetical protein